MKKRSLLYGLLLTVLAVLLAACGSGNDEGAIEVGANAPDFSLSNAAGGTVALDDYAGKPILLYFHMAVG